MASNRCLPRNMSVLRLQHKHVTQTIWEGKERLLRPRRHAIWVTKHVDFLDPRVRNLIDIAGFGHVLTLTNIDINHHLITALVERWRTETHTFHLPHGESTVTLEDVALQFGLPIDGEPVTGVSSGNLVPLCETLLGSIPPPDVVRGNTIKLSWLNNNFQQLPAYATDDVVAQYARAHIFTLIGSLLMPDTSASRVHLMYLLLLADLNKVSNYSWGSAVLACLYRALDRGIDFNQDNIGGCMLLLQCWAWERIKCLSPSIEPLTFDDIGAGLGFPLAKRWCRASTQKQHTSSNTVTSIRRTLDELQPKQFLWTPYRKDDVSPLINVVTNVEVSPVSRAVVPLICFATVEFHQVDRVMRQFGFRQNIPIDPLNLDQLHKEDMRGRTDRCWPQYHQKWIAMWNDRHNRLIQGIPFGGNGHLRDNTTYMEWYINRTIRYISPPQQSSDDDDYDTGE
ncbi:protein MAIN-LIKE 1-like isoform X2 [Vigna unguiculata]|uniref:protein MAIN-LIKE 1-like isoform X2 n=1 Tax=Vigna unguiculata TaxID=3917 RepID=UPI001016C3E3|nr:protein MAIN-LIKE 1-like isoform X2 [Vigna unguiculata]